MPDWIRDLGLSFLGSLLVLVVLYGVYWLALQHLKRRGVGAAECWWQPAHNSFRLVIRNMPRPLKKHLILLKYRVWIRALVPPPAAGYPRTFLETDIDSGERILLPGHQDLPTCCFRFEENPSGALALVRTDKLGNALQSFAITENVDEIKLEYYLKILQLSLLKHEVSRIYTIGRFRTRGGVWIDPHEYQDTDIDVFKDKILALQQSNGQVELLRENLMEETASFFSVTI